ncbi:MAG: hypothetical protein V7742_21645 [Halioglobus sp.]
MLYARVRDDARISKEERYSSRKMMNRMASVDESKEQYTLYQESRKPQQLRRKHEQGKCGHRGSEPFDVQVHPAGLLAGSDLAGGIYRGIPAWICTEFA